MSTRQDLRKESQIEYINTAKDLLQHTQKYIKKFPKSITFTITNYINESSVKIFRYTILSNSLNFNLGDEITMSKKINYIQDALGEINFLESFLSIVQLEYKDYVTNYGWIHWGELIAEERKLLIGVLKSLKK